MNSSSKGNTRRDSSSKGNTRRAHVQRSEDEKVELRQQILQYQKDNNCTAKAACQHFGVTPDKLSKWGRVCLLCMSIRDKKALFNCNNSRVEHPVCLFCYIWSLIISDSNACRCCQTDDVIIEPTADWNLSRTLYKQLKADVKNKLKDIDKELQKIANMMFVNSSKFYESYGPDERDKERKVVDKVLDYLIRELEPARKQDYNTDLEPAYSSEGYIRNKAPALLNMMKLFEDDRIKLLQIDRDQDFVQETKKETERLIPLYNGLFHQMVNLVISCYKRTDEKLLGVEQERVTRTVKYNRGIELESTAYMGYLPALVEKKHFNPPQINIWNEHMEHRNREEILENCQVCGRVRGRPWKPFVEVSGP